VRIPELREREAFDDILRRTLVDGWSTQYGHPVYVSPAHTAQAQHWLEHRLFSVFSTRAVGRAARRYVRDSFRGTPNRIRAPFQWVAGTLAATPLGMRLCSNRGFAVDPPLPDADDTIVLPGNLRVRTLDFATRTVRTMAKSGFDRGPMMTEIDVRSNLDTDLTPAISSHSEDGAWFEERLLDGVPLPRVARAEVRAALSRAALLKLEAALAHTSVEQDAAAWADEMAGAIEHIGSGLEAKFAFDASSLRRSVARLTRAASAQDSIRCAQTHGDFQPGNVFVLTGTEEVRVLDWEHSRVRVADYDRYVLTVGTRQSLGLASRVSERRARGFFGGGGDTLRATLPTYLLEDLRFIAGECELGPYRGVSLGLRRYLAMLAEMGF
jgi:hypothetical protein